jgi:CheY-like chemotaxis protein
MSAHPHVLVVEDDEDTRLLVGDALTGEGYSVELATDGAEALLLLEHVAPCAILLDIRMPGMDGVAFAQEYRQRAQAPAAIIVMTGEADAERYYRQIAADGALRKPFELPALYEVVGRFCTHASN